MQVRERVHKKFLGHWFYSFCGVASLVGVWSSQVECDYIGDLSYKNFRCDNDPKSKGFYQTYNLLIFI